MSNVLLGCGIGDALGKFAESKLSNYPPLLAWDGKTFLPSEHHGLAANFYTDDCQMSIMVAQSLIDNLGFKPEDLVARYVDWIVSGRARGYGKTTLLAVQNLQSGKSYKESGIAGSYGNGTAMRAAPFGVYFRDDLSQLIEVVKIDSAITHASEEAEAGALAIAMASYYAVNQNTDNLLEKIHPHLPDSKVKSTIYSLSALINSDITPLKALSVLGTGCDVRQTVPAVLYMFLKFKSCQDVEMAMETIIRGGKDTDTNAAILGSLYGAQYGSKCFSDYHIKKVEDNEKLINLDSQLFNRNNTNFLPG